ncbi:hypothetical protein AURDEDRAFT_170744 [Auricularia subglabra TFB-10046 SS5]|uniref:G-protein coupled receptors family 1 profile domain-containing protein n=1 Tax=Auricularia subglabra (strain TFB-10046 / SS5) TaxID=717982 RepID=J0D1X7_AURST|nr:hypothetical protein AURDEDRAFT_170744 [Auricularia subglabra TFB-10046 SS5]
MFAISTGLWAMDVANLVIYLRRARLVLSPNPTASRQLEGTVVVADKLILAGKVLFEVEFLIGDLIIAWRVLVLYRSRRAVRWIRAVFILLWLGTAGVVIREAACWIPTMLGPTLPSCIVLRKVAWVISSVLNVFASCLMWRVIRERQALLRTIPKVPGFSKTKVDRALYILLATSVLYVVSGLAIFISQLDTGAGAQLDMEYFITPATNQAVGLYPIGVTIFVLNQDTIFGQLSSSSTLAMDPTTPSLQFNGEVQMREIDGALSNTADPDTHRGWRN